MLVYKAGNVFVRQSGGCFLGTSAALDFTTLEPGVCLIGLGQQKLSNCQLNRITNGLCKKEPGVLIQNSWVLAFCTSIYIDHWRTTVGRT